MFLDPFIFTPPRPDALTRAVESYQRVAAARFCRYARDAEDPFLFPKYVRGDTLEPTSKQLHAEVRALRHLTAIQRTLRDIGGPLFNPDSPVPPRERFRLVERRMEAVEEALGAPSEETIQRIVSCPQDGAASSSSDAGSDDFSSDPVNLVNHVDSFSLPGDFELHRPRPGDGFYHPPEIEDLLEAVNDAQRVFAARAELLDKRRLELSPEDFLLEIASLRDLTAVIHTLRRMSAHRLPEDQTPEDLEKEFSPEAETAPASAAPSAIPGAAPPEPHGSHSSYPSHSSDGSAFSPGAPSEETIQRIVSCPQDCSASTSSEFSSSDLSSDARLRRLRPLRSENSSSSPMTFTPTPAETQVSTTPLDPSSHPSHRSHRSHRSHDFQPDPNPHASHDASESAPSAKSVDDSSSSPRVPPPSPRFKNSSSSSLVNPVQSDLRTLSVPRVPEVRRIGPGMAPAPPSHPDPPSSSSSQSSDPSELSHPSDSADPFFNPQSEMQDPKSATSAPDPSQLTGAIFNPKSEIPNPQFPHLPPVLHDKDPPPRNSP